MMNARSASSSGCTHTHYSTPIGLDTPGNYSIAADLVKLASYDLEHSRYFARIVALPHAVLHSGDYPRYVVNRNDLVAEYPWINGVKTGHTNDAGYVLVASGHRDGMTLISAVLGTDQRGVARREHAGAAGLRVRELPTRAPGQAGADASGAAGAASSPESMPRWSRRAG